MGSNKGYQNESLIAEALNGKTFSELNHNLQSMIKDLFGYPDDSTIECAQFEGPYKPDIYIKYKGETKYVSIKSGRANMVHGENIRDFILFLRSIGVSKQTQKTLLLFHFGDGTMDGTGEKRMDYINVSTWLEKLIPDANYELNRDHALINKFIQRVMFQGIDETAQEAGYIYFGSPEYGQIVSKRQIFAYSNSRSWQHFNCLHIGPIFFKPHARYSKGKIKSVVMREKVDCYWPNFAEDLDRIGKRFTF